MDEIVERVSAWEGVLVLPPGPGDGSPQVSWGDVFFYEAPDGRVPSGQPFAIIVTKDYPGEPSAGLNRPGSFRVNIAARRRDGPGASQPELRPTRARPTCSCRTRLMRSWVGWPSSTPASGPASRSWPSFRQHMQLAGPGGGAATTATAPPNEPPLEPKAYSGQRDRRFLGSSPAQPCRRCCRTTSQA